MVKLTSEQKKNYNRGVVILVLAIFFAAWVSISANALLLPSGIYGGMSIVSIILFFVWDKF